jgi:hypothetical protein
MANGKRLYDAAPDTSLPPTNEAVVAGGVWAKRLWQIPPWCPGPQNPKDAIEDTAIIHSRYATRLVGQHRLYGGPFIVSKFTAHDSIPALGI